MQSGEVGTDQGDKLHLVLQNEASGGSAGAGLHSELHQVPAVTRCRVHGKKVHFAQLPSWADRPDVYLLSQLARLVLVGIWDSAQVLHS